MNKTHLIGSLVNKITRFAPSLGGVFTFSDLWNLIGLSSSDRNAKVINRLVREGILFKIRRGIYTTQNPDLWVLGCRLKKGAAVSMDSILSKNLLIGTIPARSVSLVYAGSGRVIEDTPFGLLRFFSIKKRLLFGISSLPGGVRIADSEKAYLDMLYYHCRGAHFVADPITDVDLWKLDRKKIKKYLRKYKNPKFRKFVGGLIRENN